MHRFGSRGYFEKSTLVSFILAAILGVSAIFLLPVPQADKASAESGYFTVYDENENVLFREALNGGTRAQTVNFPLESKSFEIVRVSSAVTYKIYASEIRFVLQRSNETDRYAVIKEIASEIEISLSCPSGSAYLTGQTKGKIGEEIVFDVTLSDKYRGSEIELVSDGNIVPRQYDGYHLVLTQSGAQIIVNGLAENRILSVVSDCNAGQAELVGALSGYENSEIEFDVKLAPLYDRSCITVYAGGKQIPRGENGYRIVLTEESKNIEVKGIEKNAFLTLSADVGEKAALSGNLSGFEGEEIVFDVIPSAIYSFSEIEIVAGGKVLERQSDGYHLKIEKDNCALTVRGLKLNDFLTLIPDVSEGVVFTGQISGYENQEIVFDIMPKGIYSDSVLEISAGGNVLGRKPDGYHLTITKENRALNVNGLKLNEYLSLAGDFGDRARFVGKTSGYSGQEIVFDVIPTGIYSNSEITVFSGGLPLERESSGYRLIITRDSREITVSGLVPNEYLTLRLDASEGVELIGEISGYEGQEIIFDVVATGIYSESVIAVFAGGKLLERKTDGYHLAIEKHNCAITVSGVVENDVISLNVAVQEGVKLTGTVSGCIGAEIVFDAELEKIYDRSEIRVYSAGKLLERGKDGYRIFLTRESAAIAIEGVKKNDYIFLKKTDEDKLRYSGKLDGYEGEEVVFDAAAYGIYSNSDFRLYAGDKLLSRGEDGYRLILDKNLLTLRAEGLALNDYFTLKLDCPDGSAKAVGAISGYEGQEFCFDIILSEAFDRSEFVPKCNGRKLTRGDDGFFRAEINAENSAVTLEGIKLNVYSIEVMAENGISVAVSRASASHGEEFRTEISSAFGGVKCEGARLSGKICEIDEVKDDAIVKLYYNGAGAEIRLFLSGDGVADVYNRLTDESGCAKFEVTPAKGWKIAETSAGKFDGNVLTVCAAAAANVYVRLEKIEYRFETDYPVLIVNMPAPLYYGSVIKFRTIGNVYVFLDGERLTPENDVYSVFADGDIFLKTIDPTIRYSVEYYDGDALLKSDVRKYGEDYNLYAPEKEGYAFTGWRDGEKTVGSIDRFSENEFKLYAQWRRLKFEITANFGGIKQVLEFYYDDSVDIPTPVAMGKRFDGWYFADGALAIGADGENYVNWKADAEIFARYCDIEYVIPSDVYDGKEKVFSVKDFDSEIGFFLGGERARAKDAGVYSVEAEIFLNGVKIGTDVFEWEIKRAELKVGAADVSVVAGEIFSIALVYAGFAEGEDENALSKIPFVVLPDAEGEYFLKFEGGVARNYYFVYEPFGFKLKTPRLDAEVDGGSVELDCENGFCADSVITSAFSAPDKKLGAAAQKQLGGEVLGILKLSVRNHDDGAFVTLELDCLSGRKDVRAAYLTLDGSIYELDAVYKDGKISFRLPINSARYLIYVPFENGTYLSAGAIAGISAGCAAAVVLTGIGLFVFVSKKRKKKAAVNRDTLSI